MTKKMFFLEICTSIGHPIGMSIDSNGHVVAAGIIVAPRRHACHVRKDI